MDAQLIMKMVFNIVGGLAIFLLGMKRMSEGLQTIAGDRLRKLIGSVTNNRFLAIGIGLTVTSIIQSSSVTTVMVVGFVNSTLMTLKQAIGVIVGANIGTTITGWIIALAIGKYGLIILGIAIFFYLFSKNEKVQYIAIAIMGIGMVFFGLELMKNGFKPIRTMPEFLAWFQAFSASTFFGRLKCILAGCILTMIVQSSSATLGITMTLASTGVIEFETAAALVLGENIGTTITAILASIGTGSNARRAAYAHAIFNVFGVIWIFLVFPIYIVMIKKVVGIDPSNAVMMNGIPTYENVTTAIAFVHSGFNITNTIMFIPLIPLLTTFLERVVPDKPYREVPKLTRLDMRMVNSPVLGIEQSRKEVLHMGENVHRMLECLRDILSSEEVDERLVKKIFHREEVLDTIQKEVSEFLVDILASEISHDLVIEARAQLRMADEYESVSDYITTILKLYLRLKHEDISLPEAKQKDLMGLHEKVASFFSMVDCALIEGKVSILPKAHTEANAISHHFRELRTNHLDRITENRVDPLLTVTYMNMLNAYRKTRDHILNIAEALAGEK